MAKEADYIDKSKLHPSNQVALPKDVRKLLEVNAGDFVEFLRTAEGYVLIRKRRGNVKVKL